MVSLISPSSVRTLYSAPRIASESLTSRSIRRFLPSFLNTGCAGTWTLIYRSPGTPRCIASPLPDILIISPFEIPAGILMVISSFPFIIPAPLHAVHFSFGTWPLPTQVPQVFTAVKDPRNERFVSWTFPDPPQTPHPTGGVPFSPPDPPQRPQLLVFVMSIFRSVPNTASANGI